MSIRDLTREHMTGLLDVADELKARAMAGRHEWLSADRPVGLAFGPNGFRTRVTFQLALRELGAIDIDLSVDLDGSESASDIAGYLQLWLDAVVVRTPDHQAVRALATEPGIAVIKATTREEHPCEVLADAQTIRERFGDLGGVKVVFGDGATNLCRSWFHMAARSALNLTQVAPPGHAIEPEAVAVARRDGHGDVEVRHDLAAAVGDADIFLTDGWPAPSPEEALPDRDASFRPFQVTRDLLGHAPSACVVMPCPPAHRGEEIAADLLDGPRAVDHGANANLLHMDRAVLVASLDGDEIG